MTAGRALDLFAGSGAASAGAQAAGFQIYGAVEHDGAAARTFRTAHPRATCANEDIRNLDDTALRALAGGPAPALLIACPPCQGFTNLAATRPGGARADPRNTLIDETARAISVLKPQAVLFENVPGLRSSGERNLEHLLTTLANLGYHTACDTVDAADYGVAQHRRRLIVIARLDEMPAWPAPTHGPGRAHPHRTVADAIGAMAPTVGLAHAKRHGGPEAFDWHVVRDIHPLTLARLKATPEGGTREQLPQRLRPRCHQGAGSDHTNTYGRMRFDAPAPTITSGCATFSKGRFGHPSADRALSVREAATLQGLSSAHRIVTDQIEEATAIVGNALPPPLSEALARTLLAQR